MRRTCSDLHHRPAVQCATAGRADEFWRGLVVRAAISELAIESFAPGRERAIGEQSQTVICTRDDTGDGLATEGAAKADDHGNAGTRGIPASELPLIIRTPRGQGAVRAEGEAVRHACCDSDHRFSKQDAAGASADHNWHAAALRRPIAKLSIAVFSPRDERAVVADSQRVVSPCRHHFDPSFIAAKEGALRDIAFHLDGHVNQRAIVDRSAQRAVGRDKAAAEFAILIVAPNHDAALGRERDAVVGTCGNEGGFFASQTAACTRRNRHGRSGGVATLCKVGVHVTFSLPSRHDTIGRQGEVVVLATGELHHTAHGEADGQFLTVAPAPEALVAPY